MLVTLTEAIPGLDEPRVMRAAKEVLLRLLMKEKEDAQETLEALDRKIWTLEESLRSSR